MNISINCSHDFHSDCVFESKPCGCCCHYICKFTNKRTIRQSLWELMIDIKKGLSSGFVGLI